MRSELTALQIEKQHVSLDGRATGLQVGEGYASFCSFVFVFFGNTSQKSSVNSQVADSMR